MFGPEKKAILFSLPHIGVQSLKLCRQLKRIYGAVLPCVDLSVVFKPIHKFNRLCKLKSLYPLLSRSNVLYRVNCKDCAEFYVGLTTRRLEQRMKEHSTSQNSALMLHSLDTGHRPMYDSPEVLATDCCRTRLFIKESLKIQECKAFKSLNGNQGSFDLQLW